MKILVIPSWHPTPEKPLRCNWILPHITALREAGHDVFVLHVDLDVVNEVKNITHENVNYRNIKYIYHKHSVKCNKYYRTRFFYKSVLDSYAEKLQDLYKEIEESWGKPDVIHAHVSLPAGYGAAKLGMKNIIPVVVTEHYSGFESDAKFWWRVGCFVKQMGSNIQGFYAVSPGFAKRIMATGLIEVSGTLPNPIDTDLFFPLEQKAESEFFRIVITGNLSKLKGVDILFQALSLLLGKLNWSLTVLGDYQQKIKFRKWLDNPEFSKRVNLLGKISQKELVNIYSNSDLYIVASRVETANVSMLEAMACGIPVITTRCGAPETLINDSVAIVVPPEDPQAMAIAILTMSNSIEKYKKEQLREFVVCNYSKKSVVDKMITAYKNAIQSYQNNR